MGPLAGQFNGFSSCQQVNRVVPVPALRATMAAQALALRRAVPVTRTIDIVSCCARVVLFRTSTAHLARAKSPTISVSKKKKLSVVSQFHDRWSHIWGRHAFTSSGAPQILPREIIDVIQWSSQEHISP
jgi:hypothetical protein